MQRRKTIPRIPTILKLLFLFAATAHHAVASENAQHARVRIYAEPWDGKASIRVVVRFTINEGWNLYWKNPGDSGLPPEIDWKLPEGFSASELSFPTPKKIIHSDEIMFGYLREFYLTAELRPHKGYHGQVGNLPIGADVDWLVCNDRCVREKIHVDVKIPPKQPGAQHEFDRLWKKAQSTMPLDEKTLALKIGRAVIVPEKNQLRVTLELGTPGPTTVRDFYPEAMTDAVINLQSLTVHNGAVSFLVTPEQANVKIESVSGILLIGSKAYRTTFKLS
jgi:DsbC/DsbD-like thiol-disulfide interchange protein